PDRVDGRIEQVALQGGEPGQVGGILAPPGFGPAAQRAQAGARDIGQDAVERGRRPWYLPPVDGYDAVVPGAGAVQGVQDAASPVRVEVRGDQARAAVRGQ